jgi:hypothetical protein
MGFNEFKRSVDSEDEENDGDNKDIDDDNSSSRDNSNQDDSSNQDDDSRYNQETENGGGDDSAVVDNGRQKEKVRRSFGDDNKGFGKENTGRNGRQRELPEITPSMTKYAGKTSWNGNARNVSISSASNGRASIPE